VKTENELPKKIGKRDIKMDSFGTTFNTVIIMFCMTFIIRNVYLIYHYFKSHLIGNNVLRYSKRYWISIGITSGAIILFFVFYLDKKWITIILVFTGIMCVFLLLLEAGVNFIKKKYKIN